MSWAIVDGEVAEVRFDREALSVQVREGPIDGDPPEVRFDRGRWVRVTHEPLPSPPAFLYTSEGEAAAVRAGNLCGAVSDEGDVCARGAGHRGSHRGPSADVPGAEVAWSDGASVRIARLARAFPTLGDAPGLEPWDPDRLAAWAKGPAASTAGRHAAAFVLGVWSRTLPSALELPFDVHRAVHAWDEEHLAAFGAWVNEGAWLL